MIYDNKAGVSAFLSAPVELKTKKIYPIDNYGSSMAPFYSTLSIWIGGIAVSYTHLDVYKRQGYFHYEKTDNP